MIRVFTAFSGYDSQCLALNVLVQEVHSRQKLLPNGLVGLDIFDYDLVGWSEIDKYAIKAHNALFPQWEDRNYGDISKIDWSQVPDFDLFTYSSPCQDFSQAGKQAGATKGSGTRSSLLWECERAIEAKRPKYLLFENVSAVASKKFIKLFNEWQLTLERLGYTNFTQVLNAKTHGYPTPVPQNRERLFMVSIHNCKLGFYFPDAQELTTRLKDVLEDSVDEKYYLKDSTIDGFLKHSNGNEFDFNPKSGDDISSTITCNKTQKSDPYIKEPQVLFPVRNEKCKELRRHGIEIHGERDLQPRTDGISNTLTGVQKDNLPVERERERVILGWTRDKKGNVIDRHPVDVANTVTAAKRDNTQNYVIEHEQQITTNDPGKQASN